MFPVMLDLGKVPVLLAARGEHLAKRLAQLKEAGAGPLRVFDAGESLPAAGDFRGVKIALFAGLESEESSRLAALAREAGSLVNVEDVIGECDFFYPAVVRRGELLMAVSTCGASPTTAQLVRDKLAADFPAEWENHLAEIKKLRAQWRAQGLGMQEVGERTREHVAARGWLKAGKAA